MKLSLLFFVFLGSCSTCHPSPAEPPGTNPETVERRGGGEKGEKGHGAFGDRCKQDADCNAPGVCFHRKPKNEQAGGKETRGFCSITCASDSDCTNPPTSGKCAVKKKMCRRTRKQAAQETTPPGQATPPVPSAEAPEDEEEGEE